MNSGNFIIDAEPQKERSKTKLERVTALNCMR